ncbi:DUF262 domain-containing HNH endonuclease family protein [Rugamonas sp. A1-17]|nr:DUF262 domain-containing HNH endonuclease family protein [Rugamonas sp. A1-17]
MDNNRVTPILLTVGALFDDADVVYTVPIYQRNYAWQAGQIEQLLRDILDANNGATDDDRASYFLGNLMVTEPQGTPGCFEVIDGQQRLTTLYLLLTFLAENGVAKYGHLGRLRYESRPRATEALRRISAAFGSRPVSQAQPSSTEDAGIHQGYNVIGQFMAQHVRNSDALCRFASFLRTKVTVVRASLPQRMDFNRYFEIMNTRGEQLRQTDIVKARLMQHLGDDARRDCFAWIWNACSDMDSYVQMTLTRRDTDLRTRIFGDDWSRLAISGFEDLLEVRKPAASGAGALADMSLPLDAALTRYAEAGTTRGGEDQENVRFSSIIGFSTFLLHVLNVMNGDDGDLEDSLDDKRLIRRFEEVLEPLDAATRREWVHEFAFRLLRCRNLFDTFILKREYTGTNGDDGDWSLRRLVKAYSGNQPTPQYGNTFPRAGDDGDTSAGTPAGALLILQSMLRVTYTSPRTMHWMTRLLKLLDMSEYERVMESGLVATLRSYARVRVSEAFPMDEEPLGFAIGRIVFTYLDYLLWEKKPDPEYRFSFRNSIEHFYPQNPDEQQSGATLSKDWLHRLGNLALVSVGANSKFSNSLPGAKAVNFLSTIGQQSPKLQRMAHITLDKKVWGDNEAEEHHDAMVRLLREDLAQ